MVARMALPPDVENEQRRNPKITLEALDQAASKAEQAAQRLKVSSSTPFNQLAFEAEYPGWSSAHRTSSASSSGRVSANGTSTTFNQLAFEAEYPEWSLSAHRSSSASNSRRASANGTSTPFLGSSMSSEKDSIPASTNISPSTQNYTSSRDPSEAVTTEPEKLRKMSSKERGYTPSDKRQGLKPKSSGHFAGLDAHTRAGLQASKTQPSFPRNRAQHSNPSSRPSTAANSNGHALRFSNSPSSPGATDPEIIMQNHLRETSQALASETKVSRISSSFTSEDQAQAETPWLKYREVVDSIVQSLNSRYEELCPNLDDSAIRQEVFDETINELLPDLLHGSNYPNKRQAKVIRRFAKELWGQKILQHAANPGRSVTKRCKPPKQVAKKANTQAQTFSTHTDDISMMGPGVSSIQPHQARTKPLVNAGFSLESMGLSPEPKVESEVLLRSCSRSPHSHSHDQQMNTTNDAVGNLPRSEDTGLSPLGSVLESPSNQLILNDGDIKATTLSKVRLSSTLDSRTIKQESCDGDIQHSIEGGKEQLIVPGDKNISGLSLSRIPDRAKKSPPFMGVNSCGESSRSSSKYQTYAQDYTKSAGECLDSSGLDKDSFCELQSGPNQTKITNPQSPDVLLNTKEVLKPTNKIEWPSAVMSESHPILIESDNDRIPALSAPSKVLGRGATFDFPATSSKLVHSSKPKPLKTVAFQKPTPRRLTTPELISPSKVFKQQGHSSVDPTLEQVFGALNLCESQSHRPYEYGANLVANELDAQGVIKHVDFSIAECRELLSVICDRQGSEKCNSVKTHLTCLKSQLSNAVANLSSADISDVAHRAPTTSKLLALRKEKSIRRFLQSLKRGGDLDVPSITRVETSRHDPIASINTGTLLRRRAFGIHNEYHTNQQLRHTVLEHISLQRSWKGASGDIVAAAWHPNSQTYAVGATATSNPEDLQYNRPNNLLYGDPNHNTLHELPNHHIDRPKPDTIADGPNASEAVYEACDPKVYKTVSAIHFSPEGHRMLTASHDRTIKIWNLPADGLPFCTNTLVHSARLTQLDISPRFPNTFAVGCQDTSDSIHVYTQATLQSPYESVRLGSTKAKLKPLHGIYPECLRWGNTSMTENLLLAGFARWGDLPDNDPGRDGELCVWDIETNQTVKKTPSSQSVTTASFHPFLNAFATGGAPGNRLTHRYTTRTVIRTWDMRSSGCKMEFECPALDMQDLVFHPQNKDIVAVGCTDGTVYIWDARKPDYILHRLQHGLPITDWDHKYGDSPMSREQGDAGVTMALWGTGRNDLYTGATDGVVKYWDVNRAPEDALIKDIAQLQAGVSCGSFSPDGAYLLVGDSTGGVHLLASGPGYLTEEERKFGKGSIGYIPAPREDPSPPEHETGQGQGQLAAQDLLTSEQLTMHSIFGVGQGPAYAGPYAAYAHDVGPPSKARLLKEIEEQQPVSRKDGHVRDNAAARNIRATIARRRYELSLPRESEEANADISADKTPKSKKRKRSRRSRDGPLPKRAKLFDVIDLTSDKEDEEAIADEVAVKKEDAEDVPTYSSRAFRFEDVKGNEILEEDHWFPYMDLEVFAKLSLDA